MALSGWCITERHGASCKYAPCLCRCHALPAAQQLALFKGEIRLDQIPKEEADESPQEQEGGER